MEFKSFIRGQIDQQAQASESQLAFIFAHETMTFFQLKKNIEKLKIFYTENNLSEKTPVLVHLPMGMDQAVVIASLLYESIPALVLPTGMKSAEVARVIEQYPFAAVVTNESLSEKLEITKVKSLDCSNLLLGELNSISNESPGFEWLLYTSGSTGTPKIVMLSIENLVTRALGEITLFGIKKNSRILNLLPFAHDLGLNQLLTSLCSGSSLEILVNILPIEMVKKIALGEFDGVTGMPLIWNNFIDVVQKTEIKISYKGYLTVSGGSMPENQLLKLKEIFGKARVFKTYGQTETFRTFAETRQDKIHLNQCGQVLADVEVQFINDDGSQSQEGETGQLIHYGHGVMNGYWMDKDLTNSKIKSRGVLTGDYFKILPNDEYQYVGRKDDMIKHAGRRFFLGEVEECLLKSEMVQDVCVVQADNERTFLGSDKLVAFVIAKNESATLSKELRSYCAVKLESFKVPAEFIFCKTFPRTSTNKINRLELLKSHGLANG